MVAAVAVLSGVQQQQRGRAGGVGAGGGSSSGSILRSSFIGRRGSSQYNIRTSFDVTNENRKNNLRLVSIRNGRNNSVRDNDDSDDDDEEEESYELTWREDPLGLSDWKILVEVTPPPSSSAGAAADSGSVTSGCGGSVSSTTTTTHQQTQTYHVHRCALAYSERRSRYFVKLFKNAKQWPGDSKSSRFALPPLAAEAFPIFLDYIYCSDDTSKPLQIKTINAVGLSFLGKYFDCPKLLEEVWNFTDHDVSYGTIATYYEHTKLLKDDAIQDTLAGFLAEEIREDTWKISPYMISSMNIIFDDEDSTGVFSLWIRIAERLCISKYLNETNTSDPHLYRLSIHIARVLRKHKDNIDLHTFHILTSKGRMPCVDPTVALLFCEIENQVFTTANQNQESALLLADCETLSCLQKRCAEALSQQWKTLSAVGGTRERLQQRNPAFLAYLVVCCVQQATKADMATIHREFWRGCNPVTLGVDKLIDELERNTWAFRASKRRWSSGQVSITIHRCVATPPPPLPSTTTKRMSGPPTTQSNNNKGGGDSSRRGNNGRDMTASPIMTRIMGDDASSLSSSSYQSQRVIDSLQVWGDSSPQDLKAEEEEQTTKSTSGSSSTRLWKNNNNNKHKHKHNDDINDGQSGTLDDRRHGNKHWTTKPTIKVRRSSSSSSSLSDSSSGNLSCASNSSGVLT